MIRNVQWVNHKGEGTGAVHIGVSFGPGAFVLLCGGQVGRDWVKYHHKPTCKACTAQVQRLNKMIGADDE
jgi:hypothetical protein